jgi:hypothetical protein
LSLKYQYREKSGRKKEINAPVHSAGMRKEEEMKDNNSFYLAVLVAGLLCISSMTGTHAWAAGGNPCSQDITKFCKDVQKGGGRIADCLKQHENDLSAACKDHVAKREKSRELSQACKDDVAKLCKDVKPGDGRILGCLKEHKSELSAQCKKDLDQSKKAQRKNR